MTAKRSGVRRRRLRRRIVARRCGHRRRGRRFDAWRGPDAGRRVAREIAGGERDDERNVPRLVRHRQVAVDRATRRAVANDEAMLRVHEHGELARGLGTRRRERLSQLPLDGRSNFGLGQCRGGSVEDEQGPPVPCSRFDGDEKRAEQKHHQQPPTTKAHQSHHSRRVSERSRSELVRRKASSRSFLADFRGA